MDDQNAGAKRDARELECQQCETNLSHESSSADIGLLE
jgi:hypothetical protein